GCKCDWIETFDDAADKAPAGPPPAQGLEGNPAQTGEIFTQTHPYFSNLTKKEIAAAEKLQDAAEMERLRAAKKGLITEMKSLYEKTVELTIFENKVINIGFEYEGNKHVVDDIVFIKGRAHGLLTHSELMGIAELLKNSTFVAYAQATGKKVKKGYEMFYYFKDANKELYYNVAKIVEKNDEKYFLYSITRSIKK
ncbi:MAG: hypothetical protein LBK94_13170, partial [Prevotellaceae bacterium]|nr:hypothetical protein [Prevotellaceae bacterium]